MKQDAELILLWLQGDEEYFNILYKKYIHQVIDLLTIKTGSATIAKELAQETFMDVFLKGEALKDIENFESWLFTIVKYKVFNYYRSQAAYRKYLSNAEAPQISVAHSTDHLEKKELLVLIQHKIDALPPKCRNVFLMSRTEHLSYAAIAERLGISENTVDQHIRKALSVLKTVVKNYGYSILITIHLYHLSW